jgi:serine protease Do
MLRFCGLLLIGIVAMAASEADAIRDELRQAADQLQKTYVFIGGGSGVLISSDGLMVTNDHVAGTQHNWQVRLSDGRRFTAKMLGTDPFGDITVLQLQDVYEELPYVELAEASDLSVGMPAVAVGNPFSLGNFDDKPTVTEGRVGAIRVVRGNYADCLQMDAPVNPGNSGGPLLSYDGKLLGINGQIRTRTGLRANTGIGLAIACTQLAEFIPALASSAEADGKPGYAHHGDVPEGLALEQRRDGVYVSEVPEGISDIAPGDRLLRIAGRNVTSVDNAIGCFQALLWQNGRRVAVEYSRDGDVAVAQLPMGRIALPGRPWHGIALTIDKEVDLSIGGNDQFFEKAARVRKVDPGSPSERAGISVGSYVLRVEERPIERGIDLVKALVDKEVGDKAMFQVVDPDGEQTFHRLLLRPRP